MLQASHASGFAPCAIDHQYCHAETGSCVRGRQVFRGCSTTSCCARKRLDRASDATQQTSAVSQRRHPRQYLCEVAQMAP